MECPKCGRSLKNTNQDHFCGEAPKTIEEYIMRQPEEVQGHLNQVNDTIRTAIPDTKPSISWNMPTWLISGF